jgi:hypothetical protein
MEQAHAVSEIQIAALGTIRPAFPFRKKPKCTGASTNEPQLKSDAVNTDGLSKIALCVPFFGWQS